MWALLLLGCVATVSCQYYPVNPPFGIQPLPTPVQSYYRIVPAAPQVSSVIPPAAANCVLKPATNSRVSGQIEFYQSANSDFVDIRANVYNLAPGFHGFHLHKEGNTANDCKAAGPHFNPYNQTHGGPTDSVRHAGDFGNIRADENGNVINHQIKDSHISLIPGNIGYAVGRAIVVHAGEDDLGRGGNEESLKTGNAGARLACCVVEAISYK